MAIFTVKKVFDSILQSENVFKLDKITEISTFILHLIQIIHIFYFPYKYFDTLLNIFLLTVLWVLLQTMILVIYQVKETMIMLNYNELIMQMIHNLQQHLQLQRMKWITHWLMRSKKRRNKELFNWTLLRKQFCSFKIVIFVR